MQIIINSSYEFIVHSIKLKKSTSTNSLRVQLNQNQNTVDYKLGFTSRDDDAIGDLKWL